MNRQLPEVLLGLCHTFSSMVARRTLVFGRNTFPWGSSWSKTPQPQKRALSLCYLLAPTQDGGVKLRFWPPFLQPCATRGLAVLEPRSTGISEVIGDPKALSESGVQSRGNEEVVWWNGRIWCSGGGWRGVRGTLPSRRWRAASFGGELAPIRAKLQLNYFSYTGIISISSSHLMLSLLFCLGSVCPDFFALVLEFAMIKCLACFQGALYLCSASHCLSDCSGHWNSLLEAFWLNLICGVAVGLISLPLLSHQNQLSARRILSDDYKHSYKVLCVSPGSRLATASLSCHTCDGANVQATSLNSGEKVGFEKEEG